MKDKIISALTCHCPACHKGKMFEGSIFRYKLSSFDMNKFCKQCGCNLEPEIGFYYGAMFISYILTGFFSVLFVVFLHWYLKIDTMTSFGILILLLGFFFVYVYRVSRSIWAHLMINTDNYRSKLN